MLSKVRTAPLLASALAVLAFAGCNAPSDPVAGAEGAGEPAAELNEVQLAVAGSDVAIDAKSAYNYATIPEAPVAEGSGEAGALPPASAGNNGSYTPRPAEERRKIHAQTNDVDGTFSSDRASNLLAGTALAPPGAPERIRGVVSAANLLVGKPYKWGGGHGGWRDNGYDCSGAVSFALAGGGFLQAPMASGGFMNWGAPGPGQWLSIYSNPGHVYMVVGGLRWDTVGNARGSGPRWHPVDPYPEGFKITHIPGY